jgi:hypothetical protein
MGLRSEMHWKDAHLYLRRQRTGFSVEPDATYPQMWRVRRPDKTLSDMVNLARAKDAAQAMLRKIVEPE